MIVEALAILSAFFYGLSNVLIKKGLDHGGSMLQAVFVTLAVDLIVILPLNVLLVPKKYFASGALFWFVLAGVFSPGIGRMFNFKGMEKLGVALSTAIIATFPLFASFTALLLLREKMTVLTFVGIVLIIFGMWFFSVSISKIREGFAKRYLALPVMAAFFYGIAFPVNKIGLDAIPNQIFAATINITTSFLIIVAYISIRRELLTLRLSKKAVVFYTLSGISVSAALMLNMAALRVGEVSVVAPLISTFPLFAVFQSQLILRGSEIITWNIWLGTAVIVAGVILISAM